MGRRSLFGILAAWLVRLRISRKVYDIYLAPEPPAIASWGDILPLKYSDSFMDPKRVKILRGVPKGFLAIDNNGTRLRVGDRFTNVRLVPLSF